MSHSARPRGEPPTLCGDLPPPWLPFVVISGDTFGVDDVPLEAPLLAKPITAADVCLALCSVLH